MHLQRAIEAKQLACLAMLLEYDVSWALAASLLPLAVQHKNAIAARMLLMTRPSDEPMTEDRKLFDAAAYNDSLLAELLAEYVHLSPLLANRLLRTCVAKRMLHSVRALIGLGANANDRDVHGRDSRQWAGRIVFCWQL